MVTRSGLVPQDEWVRLWIRCDVTGTATSTRSSAVVVHIAHNVWIMPNFVLYLFLSRVTILAFFLCLVFEWWVHSKYIVDALHLPCQSVEHSCG
eukprot:c26715_g1_i1 orf=41-322(+)